MVNLSNQEKLVDLYVEQKNTESAVKLLFKLVVACAEDKNFEKAEALRKRLMEVDSMALTEIIKSAEIIEEAKNLSIDQNHMTVWNQLYDSLTTEEGNELYFAMKDVEYEADDIIYKEKDKNTDLYLIDQGSLKIVYHEENKENLLAILNKGQIAGADTFFSIAFCTTSLITITSVKLKVLNNAALKDWKEAFPNLKTKLSDFCFSKETASQLVMKKGRSRRTSKRIEIFGKIMAKLLNRSGQPTGSPFKGSISDISSGGLAFVLKIPKDKIARILLGRDLIMQIIISEGKSEHIIKKKGRVMRVSHQLFTDYLIHVKFEKNLPQKTIIDISRYGKSE